MLAHMLMPYRRYFDFSGRSSRKEYWSFFALFFVVFVIGYTLMGMGGALDESFDPERDANPLFYAGTIILAGFTLVSFIPIVAVEVRRWHDQGKTGWFWFFRFIPIVGFLIVLVFMALPGNPGMNKYGESPLEDAAGEFA